MPKRLLLPTIVFLAGLLVLSSCSVPAQPLTVTMPTATQPAAAPSPAKVVVGLGYIPSVQFAPFYLARERGYFAEQGLDVEFQHGIETDFLKLVASGEIPFAVGSGDQVILGRAQGLPLTYVTKWYRKFPVIVFSPAASGLDTPKSLEGHRIGLPGLFGASLVAWKALVYATGLDETKVTLDSVGFTQAAAVSEGRVDAGVDYVVNGPVQLRQAGQEVNVISVSDYIDLPSNGLITSDMVVAEQPELVQKMTTALLKGIRDTLADPDAAFAASLRAVPEAGGENEAVNRAIFDASLGLWQAPANELGRNDPAAWQKAAEFMAAMKLVDKVVPVDGIFTNRFVDAARID